MNTLDSLRSSLPEPLFKKLSTIPPHVLARIVAEPQRGQSQRELFRDACFMKRAQFTVEEQRMILGARFGGYYRRVEDREINNAIENASDDATPRPPRWPTPDPTLFKTLAARQPEALASLRSESPVPNPHLIPCGSVIDHFFKETDLLCMAGAGRDSQTEPRAFFRGIEENLPYLVPNPMSKPLGVTKKGHLYNRCLDNVGPRCIAVVEFDRGSLVEQAAIHLHLRDCGVPLRMVVYSGSKSLHGWYEVRTLAEADLDKFLRYAAYLGADPMTFGRAQLVRTPNAWRDREEERHQSVEFLA